MIADIELYIHQLNERINKLKSNSRNTLYDISIDFGENGNQFADRLQKYYSSKGMSFESKKCPRGLFDIIIRW